MTLKILYIGDIVGRLARKALQNILPDIKKEYKLDAICANAENAAHGIGITKKIIQELFLSGIDFITLGDHAFDKSEGELVLAEEKDRVIRPANYPLGASGKGETMLHIGTKKILIVNLVGRVFMKMDYDCPFRKLDEILNTHKNDKLSGAIIDFHAEASSEKNAMGWYSDGRVSAVVGTHTHIPSADLKILPQGTAYVTDIGMVGAKNAVIGFKKEAVLKTFLTQTSHLLEPMEEGVCNFNSVIIEIDTKTKKAISIKRLDKEIEL